MSVTRIKVDIAGLVGGPGLSTWHSDDSSPGYDPGVFSTAVEDFWTGMASIIWNGLTFSFDGTLDVIDTATGEITATDTGTQWTVNGTYAGDPLAPTTQGLVRWTTGFYVSGRQLQGKTFIPGPLEAVSNSPGVPSPGYISGTLGLALNYLADNTAASVYSRTHGVQAPITTATVWNKWAVLRGRRDG